MIWTKITIPQAIVLAALSISASALLLLYKKMGLDGDAVKGFIAIATPLITAVAFFLKSPVDTKPTLPPGGES